MNTSKLLEYLSIIIDLEKSRYTQEQTIRNLNSSISLYKKEYNDNYKLNIRAEKMISGSNNSSSEKVDESGKLIMYFMVYYLGFLGAGLGGIAYVISHSVVAAFIVGIIGAVIGGSIPVFVWKNIMKTRRKEAIIQSQRSMVVEEDLRRGRENRNTEISVVVSKLESEKSILQEVHQQTRQALSKCYSINIIPEKYREIVPVCMFYDYILNGRTYSLKRNPNTFDEGAINMYEQEIYNNTIINKLNTIISKLDDVRENQKVLCKVIDDGNRQTHKLLNDINNNVTKTNKKLETIQYQNEQRNKCLEYMSYVTYQRYMS